MVVIIQHGAKLCNSAWKYYAGIHLEVLQKTTEKKSDNVISVPTKNWT